MYCSNKSIHPSIIDCLQTVSVEPTTRITQVVLIDSLNIGVISQVIKKGISLEHTLSVDFFIPDIDPFSPWIENTCLYIAYDIAFTVQTIKLKRTVNTMF